MNVVIYARYSSDKQTEQSIEGQLRVCHEFAEAKGYNIINEYIDRAMTGTNDNRPSFLQMIEDAKNQEFQYIIVYKLDRFSRNTYDSVIYKHKLEQNNVKVISATENISDSPEGKLIERILETMAEMFSKDLSQKVKRGMRESLLKKQTLGGTTPFGYKVINKKLIIDEDKRPIVEFIFQSYANGMKKQEIINYLNNHGFKNNRNSPFKFNGLNSMLKNKKYIGIFETENEYVEDYCPAIISKELFNKVQIALLNNKRYHAKKKPIEPFILSGYTFCGYCGEPMSGISGTSKTKKIHSYYACHGRKTKHNCNKKNENKNKLEEEIINSTIFKIKKNKKKIIDSTIYFLNSICKNNQIEELKNRIKKITSDIDKVFNQFINTTNQELINRLNERANDLTLQKESLQTELNKLELINKTQLTKDDIETYLNRFVNINHESIEEKQKFINTFINRIYIFDDKTITYINTEQDNKFVTFNELQNDLKIVEKQKVRFTNTMVYQTTNRTLCSIFLIFISKFEYFMLY